MMSLQILNLVILIVLLCVTLYLVYMVRGLHFRNEVKDRAEGLEEYMKEVMEFEEMPKAEDLKPYLEYKRGGGKLGIRAWRQLQNQ